MTQEVMMIAKKRVFCDSFHRNFSRRSRKNVVMVKRRNGGISKKFRFHDCVLVMMSPMLPRIKVLPYLNPQYLRSGARSSPTVCMSLFCLESTVVSAKESNCIKTEIRAIAILASVSPSDRVRAYGRSFSTLVRRRCRIVRIAKCTRGGTNTKAKRCSAKP